MADKAVAKFPDPLDEGFEVVSEKDGVFVISGNGLTFEVKRAPDHKDPKILSPKWSWIEIPGK